MGLCLSTCMPKGGGDIGEEIEKDLDDINRSYIKQIDHGAPFGTTSLLAVRPKHSATYLVACK